MTSSVNELRLSMARAEEIVVTEDALTAELEDGRTISVPIVWYPRLSYGTQDERNNWRLIGKGSGIYWPDLDEHISVENLLVGSSSAESQRSLQRWLEGREVQRKSNRSDVRTLLEGIDMRFENVEGVVQRLRGIKSRLKDYDYLCQKLMTTDVTAVKEYQVKYRNYYVMNSKIWIKNPHWFKQYFKILQREKNSQKVDFSAVVREIHTITNRVETSFASKLLATINPDLAVYDSKVRDNLCLENPSHYDGAVRIAKSIEVYSYLQRLASEMIQSDGFNAWRNRFDREFPQFEHFTDIKKLDLFLWQSR